MLVGILSPKVPNVTETFQQLTHSALNGNGQAFISFTGLLVLEHPSLPRIG